MKTTPALIAITFVQDLGDRKEVNDEELARVRQVTVVRGAAEEGPLLKGLWLWLDELAERLAEAYNEVRDPRH